MPDEGTSGTGSGSPNPASPGGSPADIATQVASAVEAALTKSILPAVNAAITGRFNQWEQKQADASKPKTDPATPDPKADGEGKPLKTADEVAALRTRLNNVEAERAKERETNLRLEREADLRRSLSRPELSLINVDQAMRIVSPDLQIGSDNRFVRIDAQRGAIPLDEFTSDFAKANAHLQKPSGRSGSGGTGAPTATGNAPQTMTTAEYKTKLRSMPEGARSAWELAYASAGGVVKD